MKRRLITLLSLAVILIAGVSTVSAQKYVTPNEAVVIVSDLITDMENQEATTELTIREMKTYKFLHKTLSYFQRNVEVTRAVKTVYHEFVSEIKDDQERKEFEEIGIEVLEELETE